MRRTLQNILQENLAWAVKMLVFTVQAATQWLNWNEGCSSSKLIWDWLWFAALFPSWAVVADANVQGVHAQQHGRFCVYWFSKGPILWAVRNKPTDHKRRIRPNPDEAPGEGSGLTSTVRGRLSPDPRGQPCEDTLKAWQLREHHLP